MADFLINDLDLVSGMLYTLFFFQCGHEVDVLLLCRINDRKLGVPELKVKPQLALRNMVHSLQDRSLRV